MLAGDVAVVVVAHWQSPAPAERYLAIDRYSISDVSDRLGFAASSAFSRWFRRRFGISPTAWREATIGSAMPR